MNTVTSADEQLRDRRFNIVGTCLLVVLVPLIIYLGIQAFCRIQEGGPNREPPLPGQYAVEAVVTMKSLPNHGIQITVQRDGRKTTVEDDLRSATLRRARQLLPNWPKVVEITADLGCAVEATELRHALEKSGTLVMMKYLPRP